MFGIRLNAYEKSNITEVQALKSSMWRLRFPEPWIYKWETTHLAKNQITFEHFETSFKPMRNISNSIHLMQEAYGMVTEETANLDHLLKKIHLKFNSTILPYMKWKVTKTVQQKMWVMFSNFVKEMNKNWGNNLLKRNEVMKIRKPQTKKSAI